MKIVNRETFLAMPAGTVYSKFEPQWFGPVCIKEDNMGANDFCYRNVTETVDARSDIELSDILHDAVDNGTEFDMDFDCGCRDGLFDENQLFAIWSVKDVRELIAQLQETLEPKAQ